MGISDMTNLWATQRGMWRIQMGTAIGDATSMATVAGTIMGALPATAAILSIVWAALRIVLTCLRIGENKLFLKSLARIKNKLRGN